MNKVVRILMMCCICQMVFALDKRLDEINAIKKNPDYLYAESTMKDSVEALQVAKESLFVEINRWATETQKMNVDSIRVRELLMKSKILSTDRADMKRVFVYIKKDMVCPEFKTNTSIVDTKEDVIETAWEDSKVPSLINDSIKHELMLHFIPKTNAKPGSVINKIMKAKNFFDLKEIMEPLKKKGEILDYGKYLTAKDLSVCYLIIYDQAGNIIAWLDKGETIRKNLKSGEDDSVENYHGNGAIWFTINEQK